MVRFLVLLFCLLLPAPLLAGWNVAETAHFRLHSQGDAAELAERAALLEDFHALLVRTTGRDLAEGAPRLDVFMVEALTDASPWSHTAPRAVGYYRADAGRITAFVVRTPASARQTLLHEYAHHFMLGAGGFAYPAWYVEGFAEYYATAEFTADSIDTGQVSRGRAQSLASGPWLPLERLLARQPAPASDASAAIFYAQSWLLTHYLFRQPGMRARLLAYLQAYASGADPMQAFRDHVDADPAAFEKRLRRYLIKSATYSRLPRGPEAAPEIRVTSLPPAADALLLRQVALEHGVTLWESRLALADLRRRHADAPAEPMAQRVLALAEVRHGDVAQGARLLDNLLAETPADPDLLRWRAEAAVKSGGATGQDAARVLLARARAAAPDDWRTLHATARLHRPVGGRLSPDALQALVHAHRLAPQVGSIVLDTALALSQSGRLTDAARVLEPLALAPHGSQASALAGRMLARATAGDRAGVIAEIAMMARPVRTPVAISMTPRKPEQHATLAALRSAPHLR